MARRFLSSLFMMTGLLLLSCLSAFLYALDPDIFKKDFSMNVNRFLLFSGIGDPASRDTGGCFTGNQHLSILFHLLILHFLLIAQHVYYDFIPFGISGIVFWLICFGIIIVAVTFRHFICFITGNISGEKEAFNEYLVTIYQSYRFLALFFLFLLYYYLYTNFFPAKSLILAGFISL